MRAICCLIISLFFAWSDAGGQQLADTSFAPEIKSPAYPAGTGPTVYIDEAHNNFHTADGRYFAFARLLRRDGYVVEASKARFTLESLKGADILVIANAIGDENVENWALPAYSAFERSEIEAVREWVRAGGALMLIADHMPMPGAAEELAAEFGLLFSNGFAFDSLGGGRIFHRRSDGTLADHPITRGRNAEEVVDSVATFTGQAFRSESSVEPLMILPHGSVMLLPQVAWQFSDSTPRVPSAGMFAGAVLRFGRGRVAAFGEAAMFTAQVAGDESFGMSLPEAAQNPQFLLNVVHWLSGDL